MEDMFSRTRMLLGDEAMDRLGRARVAVFGIGGVGGHAVEALSFLADDSRPAALLLVLASTGSTPVKGGALMATDRLGNCAGAIGGGCGENQAILAARRLMGTGKSQVVTVDMTNDAAAMEGMVCGGTMDVLIEDLPVQGV